MIGLVAISIVLLFVRAVLRHTRSFGFPIEDAYIYLTYAKQFGRAHPFTFFVGGGYSAGSTSVLWPMLLAPFWTLGARGHALVWVSFAWCALFYATACIGVCRLVRLLTGELVPALLGAAMTLAVAPFAWTCLSGMEVGFAATLIITSATLLVTAPQTGPPSRRLAAVLAATALSRPEAMLLVGLIVGLSIVGRLRQRDRRAAGWWAAVLAVPVAWLAMNRVFAGHWMPNTGVAKSHFYLPGFDWSYWLDTITAQSVEAMRALFWWATSPLVWPRAIAVLYVIGAIRIVMWSRRESRWLAGLAIVCGPVIVTAGVIASSGAWSFHNYRYIAPVLPLVTTVAACALVAPASGRWFTRIWYGGVVVATLLFVRASRPAYQEELQVYAQDVVDLNQQVVTLGKFLHDKLPNAVVMLHDAGAISYYGDTRVFDMLGLVTNHQAEVANNGPGSRFEFLESLPVDQRPTHFAYYPDWMGQRFFFGRVVLQTPLTVQFGPHRYVGGRDMQLIEATWDHVHTAERPFDTVPGWSMVDRIDVAELASERAHDWRGAQGRRTFGDPTAKWSVVHDEERAQGLVIDGGRTLRGGSEAFSFTIDPTKPVRLVLRTGGKPDYPYNEHLTTPGRARLLDASGAQLGSAILPAPTGRLVEVTFDLRPTSTHPRVRLEAGAPYRAFHWFVLQPD